MTNRTFDKSLPPSLKSALGGLPARTWARQIAHDLYKQSGQSGPRVNLHPMLDLRRIQLPIRYRKNLRSRARLNVTDSGFKLIADELLQYRNREEQWRFTIAHELGHTYFYDIEKRPPKRLQRLDYSNKYEERLCDLFASELLMNSDQIEYFFNLFPSTSKSGSVLNTVLRLSELFKVSPGAISIRLVNEMKLLQGLILSCRWLPKFKNSNLSGGDDSVESTYAWRISWSVIPDKFHRKLYIPRPLPYRKGLPKLKWNIIEKLSKEMKHKEIRTIEIPRIEIGRIGNLKKILTQLYGLRENYSFEVSLLNTNKSRSTTEGKLTNKPSIDNRSQICFLFANKLCYKKQN